MKVMSRECDKKDDWFTVPNSLKAAFGTRQVELSYLFSVQFWTGKAIHSDENWRKIIGFLRLKVKQTQGNLSEKLFYVKSSFYHPFSPGMQNCE